MTVFKESLGVQGEGALVGFLVLPLVVCMVLWAGVLWAVDRIRHVLA